MSDIKNNLETQMAEIEMLQSMFPSEHELVFDDSTCLHEVRRFLDGKREALPRQLSFTVHLPSHDRQSGPVFCCSLPHKYPDTLPIVSIRGTQISREQQKLLNSDLLKYMESLTKEEMCLSLIIMWVQEHWTEYTSQLLTSSESDQSQNNAKFSGLSRMWIYSHHIYRKELLKKIPESAKELDITGFVLPGKPGILCIEGFKENCDEYWQRLKYPNWKHISCKHREDRELSPDCSPHKQLQQFRLFSHFEELAFEAHGDYGLRNDYHMDLGQFRSYLEQHKCDYVFKIFFGLQGKHSNKE